jgi:multicomponent Na+:H+ antiporter subunit A
MLWLIIIPLLSAGLTPLVYRAFAHRAAWLLAAVPIGLAAAVVAMWPEGPDASVIQTTPWIPALDIDLAFRLDGLSGTFALLICGIGSLVLLYAGSYIRDDPAARSPRRATPALPRLDARRRLSDDLFVLFVFWELTSIASYLLIGFKHEKQAARDSARQALLVTGAGGFGCWPASSCSHRRPRRAACRPPKRLESRAWPRPICTAHALTPRYRA